MTKPNFKYLAPHLNPTPYNLSMGVQAGNLVFLCGQAALDENGDFVGIGDPKAQARQIFKRIIETLAEAGATLDNVVKATVFVAESSYFDDVNEVWNEFFGENPPARSILTVGFGHPDLLVEIETIAVLES